MGQALGLVQVDQSTVAIKESFGKFDEVLEPGCHFLPWCIGKQIAGYLSLRVQQLDVRCETKTKVSPVYFLNSGFFYISWQVSGAIVRHDKKWFSKFLHFVPFVYSFMITY